jgi:hypothetical protein
MISQWLLYGWLAVIAAVMVAAFCCAVSDFRHQRRKP